MNKKFLAITITLFAVFGLFLAGEVKAGAEHNVWGWAWGGYPEVEGGELRAGSGWISFNCYNEYDGGPRENRCGSSNYGVHICESDTDPLCDAVSVPKTGKFIDYAWSGGGEDAAGNELPVLGWIYFAPAGPYPENPGYSARVDLATGEVSGWARAYRPIAPEDQTLGGWTGWIKLAGDGASWDGSQCVGTNDYQNNNRCNWGVRINTSTGEFSGWAWGGGGESKESAVIGWINFEGVETDFPFIQPPATPTQLSETWNDCSFEEISVPTFIWNYTPQGGGYQIKIYGKNTWEYTSGVTDSNSYTPPTTWVKDNLLFGEKTYSWQVRVKDENNNWSDWSELKYFQTRKHAYPWIDFSWSPEKPSVDELVEFTDRSKVYGGATKSSWDWQFPGSYFCVEPEIGCESVQDPSIKFSTIPAAPDNKVYLKVTDSDGFSCPGEEEITVTLPLPEYHEVPPTIWLEKLFAGIVNFFNGFFQIVKF